MSRTSIFVIFCLCLSVGYGLIFAQARVTYSGLGEARFEVEKMDRQVEREKIRTALVELQLEEFRSVVAQVIPQMIPANKEEAYPLRNLASFVRNKQDSYPLQLPKATALMKEGKDLFQKEKYQEATSRFQAVVDYFSFSPHVTEAYFLLAESYFQQQDFESSSKIINDMVDLFPASELTGFALLRLGKIYESQNRSTEAMDVYRTVLKSFPQRGLASEAERAMSEVAL